MVFSKVDTQTDFPALERELLEHWERQGTFAALLAKNADGPPWSFLDGPITANNPMGVHHAWGRTYKDVYQRYHAMLGHRLRYQNGFDCQGLWVEVEVEKELQLASKRDIETLIPGDPFASIDRFVSLCKARVDKFARVQTEQSIRLGYWMRWDRSEEDWQKSPDERKSYFTMAAKNNYAIWAFLKKCHDRGLIYRGYDAMPWCPRCGVGLSEMEVKEGYRRVEHKAVFVKFPLCDRPGENLLVWTTTPWTLTSNVAAAVNPELTYLAVRQKGETYYLAKGAFKVDRRAGGEVDDEGSGKDGPPGGPRLKSLEQLFKEKAKEGFEIVGEIPGAEMVGWTYEGPFDDLDAAEHPAGFPEELARVVRSRGWAPEFSARQAHRVIAWKDVGETEGTGIVHIAPGCGREDFQLGKVEGLPPVAPLDEAGNFLPGFGLFSGRSAVDPALPELVFSELQAKGRLFAIERYSHRYPHCWRCKTELLFRLVDEWFIGMSWREEIIAVTEKVDFLPAAINGRAKEKNWLENMGDWMISKKRFWGLALPIWIDEVSGDFEVIGSEEELRARAVEGWDQFDGHSPHRPWIDLVKIRNPKTGNLMSRIPDVGNPWLDAGIVPYSTMGYFQDRAEWERWFPADFITECFPGQFRNWFYALLAMSTMMENRPPFKVLLGHALVRDEQGQEMHKSAGNAIAFNEAADKMGADVMRWMYCRNNPAANINFGYGEADRVRAAFVLKLWNCYSFFCECAVGDGFDPKAPPVPVSARPAADRWILSDLHKLVQGARASLESYQVQAFCLEAEAFVDDKLSNWYVRRNKSRFWARTAEISEARRQDKDAAYQTLYEVLVTLAKALAPVVPFLSESMYQNLVVKAGVPGPASVHLADYPVAVEELIDEQLTADVEALLRLVTLGSATRNSVKIRVRQPLLEMKVLPGSEAVRRAVVLFADQLQEELNVRKVSLHEPAAGRLLLREVKPNLRTLGAKLKERLPDLKAALAAMPTDELAARVEQGENFEVETASGPVTLEPADLISTQTAPDGWAGAADWQTEVLLNTHIPEDLAREGLARDLIRYVQDLRKESGLQLSDRIELRLYTEAERLAQMIAAFRDAIASAAQVERWLEVAENEVYSKRVQLDGQEILIELRVRR